MANRKRKLLTSDDNAYMGFEVQLTLHDNKMYDLFEMALR